MKEQLMRLENADIQQQLTRIEVSPENSYVNSVAQELGQSVYGQDEAVRTVARRIGMFEAGLSNPRRPLGVVYELGPTGTGKTELAKATARHMFGEEGADARLKVINCAELSERHTSQRLTGSPPGYVGYNETPLIEHDWLHAGRSVIVWDEVEKAHPSIHKLLLGVLEEGTMDARNGTKGAEKLDFTRSLMFFTSNVGAEEIQRIKTGKGSIGFGRDMQSTDDQNKQIEAAAKAELKKTFAPEFLGRVDDVVVFKPLEKEHYDKIFWKFLDEINRDMQERLNNPATLLATVEMQGHILDTMGISEYGARDMRKVIDKEILDPFTDVVMGYDIEGAYVIGTWDKDEGTQFYTDRRDLRPALPSNVVLFDRSEKKGGGNIPLPSGEDKGGGDTGPLQPDDAGGDSGGSGDSSPGTKPKEQIAQSEAEKTKEVHGDDS